MTVDDPACVTVTFPGGAPSGEVTISVKAGTVTIASEDFPTGPYKLDFTPLGTGTHTACVSWPGGSAEQEFEVRLG